MLGARGMEGFRVGDVGSHSNVLEDFQSWNSVPVSPYFYFFVCVCPGVDCAAVGKSVLDMLPSLSWLDQGWMLSALLELALK